MDHSEFMEHRERISGIAFRQLYRRRHGTEHDDSELDNVEDLLVKHAYSLIKGNFVFEPLPDELSEAWSLCFDSVSRRVVAEFKTDRLNGHHICTVLHAIASLFFVDPMHKVIGWDSDDFSNLLGFDVEYDEDGDTLGYNEFVDKYVMPRAEAERVLDKWNNDTYLGDNWLLVSGAVKSFLVSFSKRYVVMERVNMLLPPPCKWHELAILNADDDEERVIKRAKIDPPVVWSVWEKRIRVKGNSKVFPTKSINYTGSVADFVRATAAAFESLLKGKPFKLCLTGGVDLIRSDQVDEWAWEEVHAILKYSDTIETDLAIVWE